MATGRNVDWPIAFLFFDPHHNVLAAPLGHVSSIVAGPVHFALARWDDTDSTASTEPHFHAVAGRKAK